MRVAIVLVVLSGFVLSACGDDGDDEGDLAAFCDAADRIQQAEPFLVTDDLDAWTAAIDEMEAAVSDAVENAPSDISDEVDDRAQEMAEVIAVLRGIEDPTDDQEVDAAMEPLAETGAVGVSQGSAIDVYLMENCDNR